MSELRDDLLRALERRGALLSALAAEGTDCVRLFHGTVEGRPGLTVDRYGPVLLAQTWGAPLAEGELEAIARTIDDTLGTTLVPVWNDRGERERAPLDDVRLGAPIGHELGIAYDVRPRHRGQDPLLFLDLRAGRRWVKAHADGKRVLNLFAYTCGVGLAACAGGAREVWNVDFAKSALEVGRANAERNGFAAERFRTLHEDALPMLRQLAGLPVKGRGARGRQLTRFEPRTFDVVVLDPPRWARTPFGAIDVERDYPSLVKPALLATASGGVLVATNHLPHVEREEFERMIRRTGEKCGRPIASLEMLSPEEDFPSPDGRPPLKIALVRVA